MAYFDCIVGGSGKGNTLVVTCADELAGATITCTNGTKTYTKTCPSTAPYEVTFYGLEAGTWTVSATVSGNTYTTTVVVADIEALLGGFSWRRWVDTAQFLDSTDYNSLDEVLADEEAVRELCLEHNCVDYLADIATANEDVETIINNDLFAKWVNNSDYALDFLHANEIIADYMDDADKYGYGEWVITDNTTTPPTWGAKGNVPIMTANNAPYGTVSASSSYSGYDAYKAFDGTTNDAWIPTQGATTAYIQYNFVNPIYPKKVRLHTNTGNESISIAFTLKGSNDGFATSKDLGTITVSGQGSIVSELTELENLDYYLSLRLYTANTMFVSNSKNMDIRSLQFYGRELKVSVPAMTSNTTPYGEASASSIYATGYEAFRAFDKSDSSFWIASMGLDNHVRYDFKSETIVNKVTVTFRFGKPSSYSGTTPSRTFQIQAYDGSDWTTVGTLANRANFTDNTYESKAVDIDATSCQAIRLYCYDSLSATSQWTIGIAEFQVFGKDYSEKEFEEGTNKKWLYDHGVELETLTAYTSDSTAIAIKRNEELYANSNTTTSGTNRIAEFYTPQFDLTPFQLLRAKCGSEFLGLLAIRIVDAAPYLADYWVNGTHSIASVNLTSTNIPNNIGYDVSSLSQPYYVFVGVLGANRYGTLKELWLE